MRVLMTGGGTGGHVNPALAIASTIKAHHPDAEIAFVGTSRGLENTLVPAAGYPLYHVKIQGFQRKLTLSNLKTIYYALTSPGKAKKILREFKPDVVIGTGGYVCWPIMKAAAQMGIPTALHESNALPGVAVRMLQGSVDRIFLNFKETADMIHAKSKTMHVGNPLRSGFSVADKAEARRALGIDENAHVLLSFGGSLGARNVNDAALALMQDYVNDHPEICYIHATGSRAYPEYRALFEEAGLDQLPNLHMEEYLYNMPVQMAAADVVISRAGAMTVSELAAMGKCAILIPSPNVTDNHQYKNAKVLSDKGAARLIEEKDLPDGALLDAVRELLSDDKARQKMSAAIRTFSVPDANERIYREVARMVEENRQKK
ncbi:MAG: undecaprenyldiphospho-muramoylpentapeptide beta-N-acetylglucosaminyltransferase [Clostridia bacterium]|nr:undecaprenyldiphospho-muramoylpentapeptide beta-N-acetylglucosaminyltransferase [Clostridia bacterium]